MVLQEAQKKIQISESFKIALMLMVLAVLLVSQAFNQHFVNVDLLVPSLTVLFVGFLFHVSIVLMSHSKLASTLTLYSVFLFDTLLITALIHYMGNTRSIFVIMYLINILLSGWILKRRGALFVAVFSSLSFSFLLVMGPELQFQTLLLTLLWNNLSFLGVAAFSAYVGEYFDKISDRLQETTEDLGLLKDLNHLIIESMPAAFVSVDMLGRILVVNKAAEDVFGSKLFGTKRIEDVFPDLEKKYEEFRREAEEESSYRTIQFDYEIPQQEGDTKIYSMSVSEIYGKNGVQIGRMYLFSDQTRERMLELQVKRKEKLAAIGQLAAGIAHEIRNPLASMSGSIQFLKESLDDKTEENEKLMNIVLKETDRLNDLISEFMDYVKEDPQVNDKVAVEDLIRECLEMSKFNQALRKGVEQRVNMSTGRMIWGNESKLKQVFLNLIINAYHAMEKTEPAQLKIQSELEKGRLRIRIQDSGCGMSDKVKARLFEPFHTTKAKGTGLGLATVHKILETHQAEIFVNSQEGQGSEFVIEFTRLV